MKVAAYIQWQLDNHVGQQIPLAKGAFEPENFAMMRLPRGAACGEIFA